MWSYGRQSPGTNPTVHPTFERREVSCWRHGSDDRYCRPYWC
jgi:hypothetical protein